MPTIVALKYGRFLNLDHVVSVKRLAWQTMPLPQGRTQEIIGTLEPVYSTEKRGYLPPPEHSIPIGLEVTLVGGGSFPIYDEEEIIFVYACMEAYTSISIKSGDKRS